MPAFNTNAIIICLISVSHLASTTINNEDTIGFAGMVSSAHYLASEAGRKILRNGGTAADAAVAVQNVLSVVQPSSTGFGGGVFMMYYDSNTKQVYAIDGREEAPVAFNPYVYCANITCYELNGAGGANNECAACSTIPFAERKTGGLGIGVPGTLYANKRLWETFGTVSWDELFEDAIHIAGSSGFIMYEGLDNYIQARLPYLSRFNSTCKLILNYPYCNESKYDIGDTVIMPKLANTLSILSTSADDAIDLFYHGVIASAIVDQSTDAINEITGRGGLLSLDDMSSYSPVFREPVSSTVTFGQNEYEIYGMNMPSSGPLTVQYQLKLLQYLQNENDFSSFDLSSLGTDYYSADAIHYLFSVGNIAFADRNQYMADSDFVNVPVEGLQNETYLKERARQYLSETVQSLPIPFGYPNGWNNTLQSTTQEGGTTHFCVVDQWGNVASITSTIEGAFGSSVVLEGFGFFLNNELTDFSSQGIISGTTVANGPEGGKKLRSSAIDVFGFTDSSTYGGKRPRSSMSPSIVLYNDKPFLAVGAPGGSSIIGTVTGIIAKMLIYDVGPQEAINTPRVWGVNPGSAAMYFEQSLFEVMNHNITAELIAKKGYVVGQLYDRSWGHVTAIKIENNLMYCGSDENRWGTSQCLSVCNDTESTCPYAVTTMYPQTSDFTTTDIDIDGAEIITFIGSCLISLIMLLSIN